MVSSKATVTVQLVRLMNVETRRPLDQVQSPQHHNYSLVRDQPKPVMGTSCFIQANSAWPSLCRLVECQL